jgi:hypothetical protein
MNAPIFSELECTVCSNGRLVFMYDEAGGQLFLECEECMTGYWDVAGPSDVFRTEDWTNPTRLARIDEVT